MRALYKIATMLFENAKGRNEKGTGTFEITKGFYEISEGFLEKGKGFYEKVVALYEKGGGTFEYIKGFYVTAKGRDENKLIKLSVIPPLKLKHICKPLKAPRKPKFAKELSLFLHLTTVSASV